MVLALRFDATSEIQNLIVATCQFFFEENRVSQRSRSYFGRLEVMVLALRGRFTIEMWRFSMRT